MPSGKTHTRIDLFMLVLLIAGAVYFREALWGIVGRDELAECGAVFVAAYLFGSFLLSPDMDLNTSNPMKNWGMLRLLWRPYASAFKHRGISHLPIVGTLTRVLYLLLVIYAVCAVCNALFDLGWQMAWHDLERIDRKWLLCALCGLCLPDIFHVLADHVFKNAR